MAKSKVIVISVDKVLTTTCDGKIFSHDLIRITCKNDNDIGFHYTYFLVWC